MAPHPASTNRASHLKSAPIPLAPALVSPEVAAAVEAARGAVGARPDDALAWMELGMVFDAHGIERQAAQCYGHAAKLAPAEPRAPYHLARVLARLGDGDGAIVAMGRALSLAPQHAPGHGRLGAWLLEAGDLVAARAAYQRCLDLAPEHPEGALGLTRVALASDDPTRAAALMEPWAAAQPDLGEARFLLGSAYRQLGRLDEAREQLSAWDGLTSTLFDPWEGDVARHTAGYQGLMAQAIDLGRAGDAAQAVTTLQALHDQSPDDSAVLEKLVGAYLELSRLDDAERVLADALSRDADHYRTWFAEALLREARGQLPQALAASDRCLGLHGTWARGHELRARLLWKLGDLPRSVLAMEQALRFGGARLSTLAKLARAQGMLRRWADMASTLGLARELAPEDGSVLAQLAEARAELGDLSGAWALLREAAKREPGAAQVARSAARLAQLDPEGAAAQLGLPP